MLAFFLALYNGANWTAQRVQAAMSLVFGSALALAFANALILWLTGDSLGRFMNPAVGAFSLVWIILTFVAFHINTGLATKTALLANTEIRRFMMGFIIVESATGLFFFMVPLPLWLVPVALVAILMWYLSAKMMGRIFDWNNFRVPAIWACVIILVVGLIMSFGFFDREDVQDPSLVAPYVKDEVGPYVKGQAKAAAGEIGKIFEKSPPADDKHAKSAAQVQTRPAPARLDNIFPLGKEFSLAYGEKIKVELRDIDPQPRYVKWLLEDQYGVPFDPISWSPEQIARGWNTLEGGDRWKDRIFKVSVEVPRGTIVRDMVPKKIRSS